MKITRLTSTEVANISVLPIEKRTAALHRIEEPNVRWGYSPVVNALPKILLAEASLFGHLPEGNDAELTRSIAKACKSGPVQRKACVAVARALIKWRKQENVTGRVVKSEPLRMSVDTLRYCADVVAIKDGQAFVLNLDPRSSMTLTRQGKEFIKSLIHHTALIGDLRDANAALLSTPRNPDASRSCHFELLQGEPAYSLDDILERVNQTYSIWETILRARRDAAAAGNN